MATPRFQIPDPDRPEAPALPAELLTRILKFAQAGQTIPEQFETRLVFEQVCRNWYLCDFKWRVISVKGFEQLHALLKLLVELSPARSKAKRRLRAGEGAGAEEANDVGRQIKAVRLQLWEDKGPSRSTSVVKLLSIAPRIESLELLVAARALAASGHCLGQAVSTALSNLDNIKHFKLAGADHLYASPPAILFNKLTPVFSRWPKLESLAFGDCYECTSMPTPKMFSGLKSLKSFSVSGMQRFTSSRTLVSFLPATVREIDFNLSNDYHRSLLEVDSLDKDERSLQLATSLTAFTVTDVDTSQYGRGRAHLPRGKLDNFTAKLDSVNYLTISPALVTNLASLARLPQLTDLGLIAGACLAQPPLSPGELVNLFNDSTKLKRAHISDELAQSWTTQDRKDVQDAAQGKIELNWV